MVGGSLVANVDYLCIENLTRGAHNTKMNMKFKNLANDLSKRVLIIFALLLTQSCFYGSFYPSEKMLEIYFKKDCSIRYAHDKITVTWSFLSWTKSMIYYHEENLNPLINEPNDENVDNLLILKCLVIYILIHLLNFMIVTFLTYFYLIFSTRVLSIEDLQKFYDPTYPWDAYERLVKIWEITTFLLNQGAIVSAIPKSLYDVIYVGALSATSLNMSVADSSTKQAFGRVDNVVIELYMTYVVHVYFIIMDVHGVLFSLYDCPWKTFELWHLDT
jgi:hypothetical protein